MNHFSQLISIKVVLYVKNDKTTKNKRFTVVK